MRKCLILLLVLINTMVFAQVQWRCTEEGNPFDGYVKIAFLESYSYESYIDHLRTEKLRLEVYQNKEGDTTISITPFFADFRIAVNGKVYRNNYYVNVGFDIRQHPSKHIFTPVSLLVDGRDGIDLFPPISSLIEDLKGSSNFQIRAGDKIADYKFTSKGSSSAIDCALK